jgi:hypothetical protein
MFLELLTNGDGDPATKYISSKSQDDYSRDWRGFQRFSELASVRDENMGFGLSRNDITSHFHDFFE